MKTIEDLKNLIPTIVEEFRGITHESDNHYTEMDTNGSGRYTDYAENFYTYEKDGWCIQVVYDFYREWDIDEGDDWTPPCCDLVRAWGKVTEITAYHYDEDTEDEADFNDDELVELWKVLDKELESI